MFLLLFTINFHTVIPKRGILYHNSHLFHWSRERKGMLPFKKGCKTANVIDTLIIKDTLLELKTIELKVRCLSHNTPWKWKQFDVNQQLKFMVSSLSIFFLFPITLFPFSPNFPNHQGSILVNSYHNSFNSLNHVRDHHNS